MTSWCQLKMLVKLNHQNPCIYQKKALEKLSSVEITVHERYVHDESW